MMSKGNFNFKFGNRIESVGLISRHLDESDTKPMILYSKPLFFISNIMYNGFFEKIFNSIKKMIKLNKEIQY
jgi:hypothetical protein